MVGSRFARFQEHRLPQTKLIRPAYSESFRCIGSECEDTCCRGWSVPVERAAYERFKILPASSLHALIDASVELTPEGPTGKNGSGPEGFAKFRMTESNQCPLLTEDRLCRIHAEAGEEFLPHACQTYPRIVRSIGDAKEIALALSCPEAARLVLLNPDLLGPAEQVAVRTEDAGTGEGASWLPLHFWAIRETALKLVRNRAYPLWQRLFLLGTLCRRLDAVATGEVQRDVASVLEDFEAAVALGTLRTEMETLPADPAAHMDVLLRLAGLMLHRSNVRQRFVECINAFTAGIGNGPGVTMETLTTGYRLAQERHFSRFVDLHPYILENYLINTIFRCQFPFGSEGMKEGATPSMTREFATLTAQFALMKGLLVGVAGFYGTAFSVEHVVHTVQSASKHFDHHPEFLRLAFELLVESKMDDARGLTILLRDAEPGPVSSSARPSSPGTDAPGSQAERQASGPLSASDPTLPVPPLHAHGARQG